MQKEEFRSLLEFWVSDLNRVGYWFSSHIGRQTIIESYEEMYLMVQTMWFDHRDVFPNKGVYKMVRRLFIKHLALLWNTRGYSRGCLSPDLCKEILHKADQGWISFKNELNISFRQHLIWEAARVGYDRRSTESLCYIDENLKVVLNKEEADGFANMLPDGRVEVLFFTPLSMPCSDKGVSRTDAKELVSSWGKYFYPKFVTCLPTYTSCQLANEFLKSRYGAKIHSCFVNKIDSSEGRFKKIDAPILNEKAELVETKEGEVAYKLFVSLYIKLVDFAKINPGVGFPNAYVTSL